MISVFNSLIYVQQNIIYAQCHFVSFLLIVQQQFQISSCSGSRPKKHEVHVVQLMYCHWVQNFILVRFAEVFGFSFIKMFSIIGDANVKRNMTNLNIASRQSMKQAQVIEHLGVSPIDQAFQAVRKESTVCIVASVTEMIISGGDCGTISASVDPVFSDLQAKISAFCSANPHLQACYQLRDHSNFF